MAKYVIVFLFAVVLAVPFFAQRARRADVAGSDGAAAGGATLRLIVVTPHIEQIRDEFAWAFDRWHRRNFGQGVTIDYRAPGGTTEILRLLEAMFVREAQRQLSDARASDESRLLDPAFSLEAGFATGSTNFDIMFGGGTFDHDRLRSRGVTVSTRLPASAGVQTVTIARPREPLDPDALGTLRQVDARVSWQGRSLTLRIPSEALVEGAASLRPLALAKAAGGTDTVETRLDLARCERLFQIRISTAPSPAFTQDHLDAIYGTNKVGTGQLWQDNRTKDRPEDWQHWFGSALSGFGIVYNRPILAELQLPEPDGFDDLTAWGYLDRLALADPRQSGSVATLYDSILNSYGWEKGWRVLREISANARGFASASTVPPQDVSQGDAAAGVAIDFYGRGQAQAIMRPGETAATSRVGYIDPPGTVYIDADPVSILRGGPHPELARRFVEFCLTVEAQALWQFPAASGDASEGDAAARPTVPAEFAFKADDRVLGPSKHRLRRMPVRRDMYAKPYLEHFADQTNPFEIASDTGTRGWRDGMIVMMGAFGIDTSDDLRAAWIALNQARGNEAFPPEKLAEMERLFYALPPHTLRDGRTLEFTEANYRAIADDTRRWRDPERGTRAKIQATQFFKTNYRKVVEIARQVGG